MNKTELLNEIRSGRLEWDTWLAQLDDEQMLQPGFCSVWNAKDVLAHLAWHENEMVNLLQAHALVGSELWNLPLDERNAAIYALNKVRSLAEVRDEARRVFPLLIQGVASLSEEDLHDASRFPDMPLEWQPWELIASNTYEHYRDHLPQIQAWLKK